MSPQDADPLAMISRKRLTRRVVLKGAAVLGAGAAFGPALAACGGSDGTEASPSAPAGGEPTMGGDLRVAASEGSSKEDLDVHAAAITTTAMAFRFNLYDSLLEFSPEGVLGMALAESVTPNDTGDRYTVKLKPDLVFHDGSPVDADAVVYSFNRILDPKKPGLAAQQLRGLTQNGVKKLDDLTVQFDLEQVNAIFPEALSNYAAGIVPVGYDPKVGRGVVGTGPFKLASPDDFRPGEQAMFTKHAEYWREGGGPYVDTLTMIEFNDTTAQVNALLSGRVDYCLMVPGPQIEVAEAEGFKRLEAKTGSWIPFTMNLDTRPFNDAKVRQAFRLIVDRPEIIAQAAGDLAWVGNDMYGPFDPGYPKDLPQRGQDLEQAKSLLKQAGYDGDLKVVLTTSTSVSSNAPAAATVFAQQAEGAGVGVKVNNVRGDVFWGDQYLKYPFAMDNWGTRGYLAQAGMGTFPGAVYDETHFAKHYPEWVTIVEEAYQTVDDTRRNELITEAAALEYDAGGYIIYMFDKQVDMHSDKVAGAVPDFSGLASAANNARFRLVYFA